MHGCIALVECRGSPISPTPTCGEFAMLTFNVVKEPHGWSIQMGEMTTPYRSRSSAIQAANELAAAIRRQGGFTQVVIESVEFGGSEGRDVELISASLTQLDTSAGSRPDQVRLFGIR